MQTPVPSTLQGLWRRRSLRVPGLEEDRLTQVFWLQGPDCYIDLRIPPRRPDFSGIAGLGDLSLQQALWLATQQGFAGRLYVEGDIATWRRDLDYQPPGGIADVGRLQGPPEHMIETGVLADYTEVWERVAVDDAVWVLRCLDGPGYLIRMGGHFMFALGRPGPLTAGLALVARVARHFPLLSERRALLGCEICYGLCQGPGRPWLITHSTFPWREGRDLLTVSLRVMAARGRACCLEHGLDGGAERRRWELVGGSAPLGAMFSL